MVRYDMHWVEWTLYQQLKTIICFMYNVLQTFFKINPFLNEILPLLCWQPTIIEKYLCSFFAECYTHSFRNTRKEKTNQNWMWHILWLDWAHQSVRETNKYVHCSCYISHIRYTEPHTCWNSCEVIAHGLPA